MSADASLNVQETGEHGKILTMLGQRPMRRCQRVVWADVFRKPVVMIDGARDIKTRQSRRIALFVAAASVLLPMISRYGNAKAAPSRRAVRQESGLGYMFIPISFQRLKT